MKNSKDKEYCFVKVSFDWFETKTYFYLCKDKTIQVGDEIFVRNRYGQKCATVLEVIHCTADTAPWPVAMTKYIDGISFRDLNTPEIYQKIEKIENFEKKLMDYIRQNDPDGNMLDRRRGMGTCFYYWRWKKRFLKEVYGIDWFTPHESNPTIIFD